MSYGLNIRQDGALDLLSLGALILTIALLDELSVVATRGRPSFRAAEDAITVGKEG